MLLWSAIVGVQLWLQLTRAVYLKGTKIGVKEPAKVWSILNYLVQGENPGVLGDLYPLVMGLDADEGEFDSEDRNLASSVADVLGKRYGMVEVAGLLPLYANLYPMGLLESEWDTSGENYFVLNGKRYWESEDVFYLKSKELKNQAKLADSETVKHGEFVIGTNKEAPIVVLYGCPGEGSDFEDLNRNLYSEASSGKLRYVWRSTCPLEPASISGIPLTLTPRNDSLPVAPEIQFAIPKEFNSRKTSFYTPTAEELSNLDLKVTKLVADHYLEYKNFSSTLRFAKGIINNLPVLLRQLVKLEEDTTSVLQSNEKLKGMGIGYDTLGIYVNGQNLRLSEIDSYSLLHAVNTEYKKLKHLMHILQGVDKSASLLTAKHVLREFSGVSLPNLEELQPIKVDLHRIQGFSESVVYFNDIEQDGQYADLSTDPQKFFDQSKFGELPEYRHNWNEVIFVIDFGQLNNQESKLALDGLVRAVKVIAQGYPQRVGLLPLNTGSGDGLIHQIYRLRDRDLSELVDFLEKIPSQDYISKRYDSTPDYSKISEELQISETSIIINGEIYPFKKNAWHYLIAKVIKKDKAFLQKELSKFGKKNLPTLFDVRGLLHLRSSNTRHGKYAPDYFVDASYTSLNNTVLRSVEERVLEHIMGKDYQTLHTVTLSDNFDTTEALQRLKNLLSTSFVGVRIRLIHTGSVKSRNWRKLRTVLPNEADISAVESLIMNSEKNRASTEMGSDVFREWLMDFYEDDFTENAFLVVNGRFIVLGSGEIPGKNQLEAVIKREAKRTLDTLQAIETIIPDILNGRIDPDFIEMASSVLSKLFYHGGQLFNNGIDYTPEGFLPRINVNLEPNNHTIFQSQTNEKPVDVSLFMDPTEERSQTLVSFLTLLEPLPFVNLRIILLPTEDLKITPINRIYVEGEDEINFSGFEEQYQVEVDAPSNLFITNNTAFEGVIVEAHAFKTGEWISESKVDGVGGVCLELVDAQDKVVASCITMKTFGYGQLVAKSFQAGYSIRSCDPRFKVKSIAANGRSDYMRSTTFPVSNFDKAKVHVEVEETLDGAVEHQDTDERHIFTILKDNGEDETKARKMILSIFLNADKKTKIWILDQPFLSKSFKEFCQKASNSDDFQGSSVEFIKFKWPLWLRPQRFSDRRMDLFKVLFADIIFPQNISKIVYLEPSSSPVDPAELYDQDSAVPFSLFEAPEKGYWNGGYWSKTLKERGAKFHTTEPAFIINLQELRKLEMGDRLRVHYQRLSADRHSLINGAQDLLNDLQVEVPINTLEPLKNPSLKVDDEEVDLWLDGYSFEEEANEELAAEDLRADLIHDEL